MVHFNNASTLYRPLSKVLWVAMETVQLYTMHMTSFMGTKNNHILQSTDNNLALMRIFFGEFQMLKNVSEMMFCAFSIKFRPKTHVLMNINYMQMS